MTRLESATPAGWWTATVDDLNACAISHEVRALTADEQREFDSNREFGGDGETRFLILPDPCVKYSYITRNAFVMERVGRRVYATQVVDAFYTRLDPGVEIELARHNDETLVIVETASEPTPTSLFTDYSVSAIGDSTYSVYAIDRRTHHAVPRNLFMDNGKLINEFQFEVYLFDDEEIENQWHLPELVRNGRLSPQFYVYTLSERQGRDVGAASRLSRKTYVWNGKYYALQ